MNSKAPRNFPRCKTAAQQNVCSASKPLLRRKTFAAPQNLICRAAKPWRQRVRAANASFGVNALTLWQGGQAVPTTPSYNWFNSIVKTKG
jgi:hypothetical protein